MTIERDMFLSLTFHYAIIKKENFKQNKFSIIKAFKIK